MDTSLSSLKEWRELGTREAPFSSKGKPWVQKKKTKDGSGIQIPAGAFKLKNQFLIMKTKRWGCRKCVHCGFCCREWDIYLSKYDIRKLVKLGYPLKDFLILKPYPRLRLVGKRKNCIFLDEKNLCEIQKNHGYISKPYSCQKFPERIAKVPKGEDYLFYKYEGKTFTRDILILMLEKLKSQKNQFFSLFYTQLESLRVQRENYVDTFNYEDRRIGMSSKLTRLIRLLRLWSWARNVKSDFLESKCESEADSEKFISLIQELIRKNKFLHPDFPLKLLRFFYVIRSVDRNVSPEDLTTSLVRFIRKYR
jgi:Fe-S-cluster containining protein